MSKNTPLKTLKIFSEDIKLSHSLFSFPFVGASLILSQSTITLSFLVLIFVSLTTARSFAMGINRYFDREIDAKNPRTANRAIPGNKISNTASLAWTLTFALFFIISSYAYNQTTFFCSLPLLGILGIYPLTKRLTWLCHLYLGLCLALSPLAASIALNESLHSSDWLISAAILFWVCGFDIIYATQDLNFDKQAKLFSIPSYFGLKNALIISKICFLLMLFFLCCLGYFLGLGWFYFIGLITIALILGYEHYSLARMTSFEKINPIFFTANAWVSFIFLSFVCLETFVK